MIPVRWLWLIVACLLTVIVPSFVVLRGTWSGPSGRSTPPRLRGLEKARQLTEHRVVTRVGVVDSQGTAKIRSQPVVFFMKQTNIANPAAVGPKLKPPPRSPNKPPRHVASELRRLAGCHW